MTGHGYMFGDRDGNSQRRRRENNQVELRRQRTEELLKKKRASAQQSSVITKFHDFKESLFSDSLEELYNAAYGCRTRLSVESNPPIEDLIMSGLVPRFVELLRLSSYEKFFLNTHCLESVRKLVTKTRIEAAWVLTNVASGTTEQTYAVVNAGAVPFLVDMLSEEDDGVIDQSVWALGNIAGDNEETRDMVINLGVMYKVVALIEKYKHDSVHIKILRNLVWLLSNITRGRNPPPPSDCLEGAFRCIESLIVMDDPEIFSDCAWGLSYIADVSSELTERIVRSVIMERCFNVLNAFVMTLRANQNPTFQTSQPDSSCDPCLAKVGAHAVCPIIRLLGNITTGSDEVTDFVVSGGFLGLFLDIFYSYKNRKLPRIQKEICWLLSNIAAGNELQRRQIVDSKLLDMLIDAVARSELFIRKEALFGITTLLYHLAKSPSDFRDLNRFLSAKLITALQSYLYVVQNSPDIQSQILDAVRYTLEAGVKLCLSTGTNPVVDEMIESKLVDDIEDLQVASGTNVTVVQKAYSIIIDFFDGVDE